MSLDLPRDNLCSVARSRLCAHPTYWNSDLKPQHSPTCDFCNAYGLQDEQYVLIHYTHPHVVSLRKTCASLFPPTDSWCVCLSSQTTISVILPYMILLFFTSRLAVALLDWRPFSVNPCKPIDLGHFAVDVR